eukprot:gene4587-5029_t
MERGAFEKELAKYKIVRLEDHYTPRLKTNVSAVRSSPRPLPSADKEKKKIVLEDDKFWTLIEKVAADILSEEEVSKFLAALKKAYADVPELVNLEDLNVAASLVKVN